MITKKLFGSLKGEKVYAYTLEEGDLQATVIDLGASVQGKLKPTI